MARTALLHFFADSLPSQTEDILTFDSFAEIAEESVIPVEFLKALGNLVLNFASRQQINPFGLTIFFKASSDWQLLANQLLELEENPAICRFAIKWAEAISAVKLYKSRCQAWDSVLAETERKYKEARQAKMDYLAQFGSDYFDAFGRALISSPLDQNPLIKLVNDLQLAREKMWNQKSSASLELEPKRQAAGVICAEVVILQDAAFIAGWNWQSIVARFERLVNRDLYPNDCAGVMGYIERYFQDPTKRSRIILRGQ